MHKAMFWLVVFLATVGASCDKNIAMKHPKIIPWEKAIVISQDISSERTGVLVAPIGSMIAAVPRYRKTNRVVVKTETHMYEWIESGRNHIILTVGSTIDFYREGDRFIVLDSKQKKH
jgi:hypothetical protein